MGKEMQKLQFRRLEKGAVHRGIEIWTPWK